MDKQAKLDQIKADMESEWWRAGVADSFNLKNKLLRVGCRPLKRKYLSCIKMEDNDEMETFGSCKKIREETDECYKALHFLNTSLSQERVHADLLQPD